MKARLTISLAIEISFALALALHGQIRMARTARLVTGQRIHVGVQIAAINIRDFVRGLPKSERSFVIDTLRDAFAHARRAYPFEA